MPKKLPARPNLEYLRTQAKALLAALREGDQTATRLFAEYLPEAALLSPQLIFERGVRLADAQAVIARKTGFSAWPSLAHHVDTLRRMEGTWTFASLEIDGQSAPRAMLSHSCMLIDGDRFRMESPEANYDGIFTIDVEAHPHRIDIDFIEGPEAGNRCQGLFRLDADELRFCLGLVGSTRPEHFATSPGSGHALEVLVRAGSGRPAGVDGGTAPLEEPKPAGQSDPDEFDTQMTPTLERLQGEWTLVHLITSGSPLQASYLAFGSRTQAGVETKVVFGGQTIVHAKVRFHESRTPIEVELPEHGGKELWVGFAGAVPMGRRRSGVLHGGSRSAEAVGFWLCHWKRANTKPLEAADVKYQCLRGVANDFPLTPWALRLLRTSCRSDASFWLHAGCGSTHIARTSAD